jgi:hypothetical protein
MAGKRMLQAKILNFQELEKGMRRMVRHLKPRLGD